MAVLQPVERRAERSSVERGCETGREHDGVGAAAGEHETLESKEWAVHAVRVGRLPDPATALLGRLEVQVSRCGASVTPASWSLVLSDRTMLVEPFDTVSDLTVTPCRDS